ncbi:Competence-specific sigma factor ComX [Streptococcus macedonicus]|uniref:sigma-70 family RNA polymerase sigma factor n=1 Tax=Streptococcus macedonicus TaxID=59310 RepID=UPI0008127330|nr:sigma-70 family RNA polymerase sigma factor [Streptococcus macedonicus]SCA88888.1 Competence-specific sigma factor ComX [Streptococcus macedonicus]
MMETFESYFEKVKPIVLKLRRHYFVKLWDYDDWLQEGRVVLFCLLQEKPNLLQDDLSLYAYFKTKFSNYLKDVIRHQESLKRKFNQLPYEEISDVGHCLAQTRFLDLADYVAYKERLQAVEQRLGAGAKEKLAKVMRGERFEGKKAFLTKIEPFFTDFNSNW